MAEKSDDKSSSWREKYLDALDQQEQLERNFAAQQELLRRALVRVSVSADGQDDALDAVLDQLREQLRGGAVANIETLLARLDHAVLGFEESRAHNAQAVRESLSNTVKPLQTLDLSREVKKDIKQYLSQLPERSKKVRLYPALLQQLATIQQQALKEIEQPKTGLLQKILGGKPGTKTPDDPVAAADEGDSSGSVDDTAPPSRTLDSSVNTTTATRPAQDLSPEFIDKVIQIINQFLVGLEHGTPLAKKVQELRKRINAGMNTDVFLKTLESLRDLVVQADLSANKAFANYLKNVNEELSEIYSVVGGSANSEATRRTAVNTLQTSMMQEMSSLEANTESATDLSQLKSQVKSQIGNIRKALDYYQQVEQAQNKLASQLEVLGEKIKVMEMEAEKNRAVLEKQRHKALHDPLTELPNREYYNERATYEFQRWQRYGRPLTFAVFDIDHFKKVNDNHGHQAGDKILKVIGRSVMKRLREVDFFCRFGGEEFIAIMPETNIENAMPVLDKIRHAIANAAFNYNEQSLSVTLSIGATEFKKGDTLESAFARADQALYSAKSAGRNCIQSA